METKTVFCPHCQSSLETPTALEGKEVTCPVCKKNFTIVFQPEPVKEESGIDSAQKIKRKQPVLHFARTESPVPPPQTENSWKTVKEKDTSSPLTNSQSPLLWIAGGCACLLLIMNILLGFSLFFQKKLESQLQGLQTAVIRGVESPLQDLQTAVKQGVESQLNIQKKLENRLQGLQTAVNQGFERTGDNQRSIAKDISTLAGNTSYKPVTAYKIINYTWEYSSLMESEFRKALDAGFEPAGYLCQNSIKGGMFLFVKRAK